MKMIAIRLLPGQDLKEEIENIAKSHAITAGYIATCVGSLRHVSLRMAGARPDKQIVKEFDGHFEIVSLVGTLSQNGMHVHMSVSDSEGVVTGGHLKGGCSVATTAELVIGYDDTMVFDRTPDLATGFDELTVGMA